MLKRGTKPFADADAVAGMDLADAVLVEEEQPYTRPVPAKQWNYVLSELDNRDKHRQLLLTTIVMPGFLISHLEIASMGEGAVTIEPLTPNKWCIARGEAAAALAQADFQVEFRIGLNEPDLIPEPIPLHGLLDGLLDRCRQEIDRFR